MGMENDGPERAAESDRLFADLAEAGRWEEATEVGKEALDQWRALAEEDRDRFLPQLTRSLEQYYRLLGTMGDEEELAGLAEEATDMWREWVREDREGHLPHLALSQNLFCIYMNAGMLWFDDQGDTETESAVALWRELVGAEGDTHLPGLARSLVNVGTYFCGLGEDLGAEELAEEVDLASALAHVDEGVELYRKLTALDRPAFQPDLAQGLKVLGVLRSMDGRLAEARDALEEAMRWYDQLPGPGRVIPLYAPDRAEAPYILGTLLAKERRWEDAEAAFEASVTRYRELNSDPFRANKVELANSLLQLSRCRCRTGRFETALGPAEEAASLYREANEVIGPNLRFGGTEAVLGHLRDLLQDLGRQNEAEEVTEEIAALHRR